MSNTQEKIRDILVGIAIGLLSIGCMKNGQLKLDPTQFVTDIAKDALGNVKHESTARHEAFDRWQKCIKKAIRIDDSEASSFARKVCTETMEKERAYIEANSSHGFIVDSTPTDNGQPDKLEYCIKRAKRTSTTIDQRSERINECKDNYE